MVDIPMIPALLGHDIAVGERLVVRRRVGNSLAGVRKVDDPSSKTRRCLSLPSEAKAAKRGLLLG